MAYFLFNNEESLTEQNLLNDTIDMIIKTDDDIYSIFEVIDGKIDIDNGMKAIIAMQSAEYLAIKLLITKIREEEEKNPPEKEIKPKSVEKRHNRKNKVRKTTADTEDADEFKGDIVVSGSLDELICFVDAFHNELTGNDIKMGKSILYKKGTKYFLSMELETSEERISIMEFRFFDYVSLEKTRELGEIMVSDNGFDALYQMA